MAQARNPVPEGNGFLGAPGYEVLGRQVNAYKLLARASATRYDGGHDVQASVIARQIVTGTLDLQRHAAPTSGGELRS